MSISPWMQYDTSPPWQFPLILDSGIFNIAGLGPSNFAFILHNTITTSPQEITGGGTFGSLTQGSGNVPSTVIYHQIRADVASPGTYRAWIIVTDNSGNQESFFAGYIEITSR